MTRLHPFQYVFSALADQRFGEIQREAAGAGLTLDSRLSFLRCEPVRRLLDELRADDPAAGDLGGAALEEYGALLYHAYRYWAAGQHSLAISRAEMEALLHAPRPTAPPDPAVPHGACYLQLPEQWMWARISPDAPHEPLDGLFLASEAHDQEIALLAVLGLRPARPGFSQVALSAPAADFRRAAAAVREPPFAPVMDGGDRAGVRSVVSEGELLHLAHLALIAAAR